MPAGPVIKLSAPATREFWELAVLHEDEHLVALDKPAGLLTTPDPEEPQRPNLMTLLHEGIAQGAPWAKARNLAYLTNAHRLDFETSGICHCSQFASREASEVSGQRIDRTIQPRQTRHHDDCPTIVLQLLACPH